MDLAAGVTLKRWARRHPNADIDAKLAILRQVAAALDYAHAEKVIHRDVKPENVMVDDGGRVKVLDFGLAAQIRSSQSRMSNTVTSKGGTPGYKSPEQWLGRPQQASADIYAFGVMAYWLFAGHLPFDGDDPTVLGHAVLSAPVEPIPDLPAHMNVALEKALAKAPEDRFASCGAFVDALEEKVSSRVDDAGGLRFRATEEGGPCSRAAVKPLLAAAALVLAIVGGWWWANRKTAVPTETTGVPPVAMKAPTGTTGVSPVATNDTRSAPTTVSPPGSGASAASPVTSKGPMPKPTPQPTWEERQRAVNDAKRHVVFIRKRVESIIEETIKPYRSHGKYFGEILAEIDRQYDALKNLKAPATIAEARRFTTDAENAADEIENKGVRKLEKRLKFCVSEEIRSAKEFFGKSERGEGNYWNEAIAAAGRALALEPSNAEAKKLKKDAESHLLPTMRVVAKIDGREISGAKVKAGDESFTTPVVWKLKEGSRYGPYAVSYESGGRRYYGTIDSVTVDWRGLRVLPVVLKEYVVPKHGDTKTLTLPGGATMELIYVAPGTFTMGSPTSEVGHSDDEAQHQVTLTKGFWLGKYEVTQAQWESVMGETPSRIKGGNRPVENVSWEDCQRFISKINSQLNCGARLPTEAEWEYTCRAGSAGPYAGSGNLDDMGWYGANSDRGTHPVGQKQANAWGFYDMHGNVVEWCDDWYGDYGNTTIDPTGPASGGNRVARGASWVVGAQICRSANRIKFSPGNRGAGVGFRLCCSAGPSE